MKQTLLFCAFVGYAIAVPSGTFHQEYSYKASSSSFKNNELQHRTDDQGYYKKDGDLDGRTKPRVDANSEHSEYVNPNSRGNVYGGYGESTDMNSHGLMNAQSGMSGYGTNQLAEGIASSDRIIGSRGYSGSSNYGSNNYGMSNYDTSYGSHGYGSAGYHSASYGSSANIQSIIHRLQQDFEREIQNQRWRAQAAHDQNEVEKELRQKLTERLNSELVNRYGQQTIRNGMSYSIADGQVQSSANYNNQDLTNLRQQLENNLLSRLRTQNTQGYGSSGSRSSHYESHSESQRQYGYTSSTVRPIYHTLYPTLPVYSTTQRSTYTNNYGHSNYEVINSNTRYTPIAHPESISTIASSVQSQLDNTLNRVLDDIYRQHFSSSASYQLTNYDVVLNRVQNELRNNLTYLLDDQIRRNYGSQTQRDGYYYTIGPQGQLSSDYNYALKDLEQLKAQVENNLIEKLNRQFETYRSRYRTQSHSYNSQSNYGSYDSYSTTPRYIYSTHPIPYTYSTTPRSQYYTNGGRDQYGYAGGSRQSGYEMSGGYSGGSSYSSGTYSSANMGQLQRQLQDELSRQLQAAISRDSTVYSSSGSYSPQNYQTSLQHLTDELNRNVTKHLQEYSASASYSASGNYDQAQIENLRSQLLSSLTRQLQQNLQQHFQSSSAYSSSSSSNYRPVRGFSNHLQGQYKSGGSVVVGEDCDHNGLRLKRSLYLPYRDHSHFHHHSHYSNYHEHNHNSGYHRGNYGGSPTTINNEETGQEAEETGQQEMNLGQEIEVADYNPSQSFQVKPQKIQEETDAQQIQEDEFEPLQIGQQQYDVGQQIVEQDYGNLQIGQQTDDSESTQQVEVVQYPNGPNYQVLSSQDNFGQEVDNSELTQQIEDGHITFNHPASNSQIDLGQEIDNSELTVDTMPHTLPRQTVYNQEPHVLSEYNSLQSSRNHVVETSNIHHNQVVTSSHNEIGQEVDNTNLNQQIEEFDNPQVIQQEQELLGQLPDDSEPVVPIVLSSQKDQVTGQELDNPDLTQQVEVEGIEPIQSLNHNQPSDYTPVNVIHPVYQSSFIFGTHSNPQVEQNNIGQEFDDTDTTLVKSGDIHSQQNQESEHNYVYSSIPQSSTNQLTLSSIPDNLLTTWTSYKWKPSQERFIESIKQRLLMKQNSALQSKQSFNFDRDTILSEITANVTHELKSYSQNFLTHHLELKEKEIQGIKMIIDEYLRQKFYEHQKFNQQAEINRNVEQNAYGTNLYFNQQPQTIPAVNFQQGQVVENDEQQFEDIESLHSQSNVMNVNNENSPSFKTNSWYLTTWTEKQQKFVESIFEKLFLRFNQSISLGQFTNFDKDDITKKVSEEIESEFENFSRYYLFQLLGFKEHDIKYIKEKISQNLCDRLIIDLDSIKIGKQFNQHSFVSHQHDDSKQNVEQLTHYEIPEQSFQEPETDEIGQQVVNQQTQNVESQSQHFAENDYSQTSENEFVAPLNVPKYYSNNFQKPVSNGQYSQTSLNSGLSYQHHPRKPNSLPDSSAFIADNIRHHELLYSPTLNKVLNEENLEPSSSLSPQQQSTQQETVNEQSGEIHVPLHKPPAPWFLGSPNQHEVIASTSEQNIEQESANQQPMGLQRIPLYKSREQLHFGSATQSDVKTDASQQTIEQESPEQFYFGSVTKPKVKINISHQTIQQKSPEGLYFGSANQPQIITGVSKQPIEQESSGQWHIGSANQGQVITGTQSQHSIVQESIDNQQGEIVPHSNQKPSGERFELTSQGQMVTSQQTLANAENTADELLRKLHELQIRKQQTQSVVSEDADPRVNSNHYGLNGQTSTGTSTYTRRTGYNAIVSQDIDDDSQYGGRLNYGRQQEEQQNIETTGVVQPISYGRADVVQPREPQTHNYPISGVKGYQASTPGLVVAPSISSSTAQPEFVSETQETTISYTADENLPWWKRFGNKIKQGASDLKKKIVG